MKTTIELRRERAALIDKSRELLDTIEAEPTGEQQEALDRMEADIDALEERVIRMEKQERREAEIAQLIDSGAVRTTAVTDTSESREVEDTRLAEQRHANFIRYMAHGFNGLQPEQRATLQIDSDKGAAFVKVTQQFVDKLIMAVDSSYTFRDFATKYRIPYGVSMGAPKLVTDIGAAEFGSGELTSASEDTALELGLRELTPRSMKKKLIKLSEALANVPGMDLEKFAIQRMSFAYTRGTGATFMTGTGANEPLGLFIASDNGLSSTVDISTDNSDTAVKPDNLISVQETVPDAYQANCKWVISRTLRAALRKFKTGAGDYMLRSNDQSGGPLDSLLGKPIIVEPDVPTTFTSGLYVGLYGDLSWYWITEDMNWQIQRLTELYALTGQIGLLLKGMACDGAPVLEEAFARITLG